MENLPFVLWVVSYPLASSISRYLAEKTRRENNEKPYSDNVKFAATFVDLLIWIIIANKL